MHCAPRRKKKVLTKKCCTRKIKVIVRRGPRGPAGRVGPRGPAGPAGPQGVPGPAGTGLLSSYDFVEIPDPMVAGGPAITSVPLPVAPATVGPEVQVSGEFVTLGGIGAGSRVALSATVVWSFMFSTATPQLAVASQVMRFSIYRDAAITGTLVGTIVDGGTVTEINTETGTTEILGVFTSAFTITDTGAPGPSANYFLTAAAGPASGFSVADGPMGPMPITNFNNPVITEIHFNGEVIGPNTI
ncbi:collagen-like protein [Paenibacillus arenilitoris]|uniref:Collagen-like protein n=1 Tax=Paenibacillus arenilitoris TaxID=2772299 RepID=A0A927CNS8_9BACL|nr:collagen-like protein [Paenibacillus arenilitoris]MBD2871409.1 collagen-like protein [Paenibacillus arenilitoris]